KRHLVVEVILQRLRSRGHVLHGVVLLVALLVEGAARTAVLLVEVVLPVAVQGFEAGEVGLLFAALLHPHFLCPRGGGFGGRAGSARPLPPRSPRSRRRPRAAPGRDFPAVLAGSVPAGP